MNSAFRNPCVLGSRQATVALRRSGFSLVEILIVVMIIGILAAIAIPKMSNASQLARENAIRDDLRLLRTQLGVYKSQHAVFPGFPHGDTNSSPTAAIAYDQLTKYSDNAGNTSGTGGTPYVWGPYMENMPINPVNGLSDWKILGPADPFTADGTTGWLYQPATGDIRANTPNTDSSGRSMVEY